MTTIKHKGLILFLTAIFFIAVGLDTYSDEINYSFLPPLFLLCILLLQHPQYLLYALLISIPWSVEYHFDGNLSTDFPDEPLMLLASAAGLILLIYNRKKANFNKMHPILIVILFQFVWTIVTVVNSTNILLSTKYLLAKSWYLWSFLILPVFLFRNETILKRSVVLLVISMFSATLVALARHSEYNWHFENVNDAVSPFFHNHVLYSALLAFIVPMQVAIIQLSTSHKTRTFITYLLIITVAALYLSYSRGSWVGLIAGIFSYWLLRKRMLVFSFLFFISLSLGAAFWLKSNGRYLNFSNDYKTTIFHTDFKEHLIATYKLKDLSNAERIYRWVAGAQMITDYWKTGTGPTTFYEQYKGYTVPAFRTYVSDNKEHSTVHNYFLLLLIEQGIVGILLFVVLVTFIFWYAQKVYYQAKEKFWKVVAASVASIIVMECVVNFLSDMIETDKVGSVFYLCIAALIIADTKTRNESNSAADVQRIS